MVFLKKKVKQPIIHNEYIASRLLKHIERTKERLFVPKELIIVTCHNYRKESLFEKSLKRLGIHEDDYMVLKKNKKDKFRHSDKLMLLLDFLKSSTCKRRYILFCDARDTILRVDPQIVLDLYLEFGCDLLFQSSYHGEAGYKYMPEKKHWADSIKPGRYLNSGVYIGKVDFIIEVMEEAVTYITGENDELSERDELAEEMAKSDQYVLRYLHPKYYPKMQIDYENKIAFRWKIF